MLALRERASVNLLQCARVHQSRTDKAKTTINLVTVLLVDTLTNGERGLAELGRANRITQFRHDHQLVMRDDL